MQRHHQQLRITAIRQAFTLVELLIVCAIIGILVGLTFYTVNLVSHSSKVAKTRSTIQKIDVAMMQIFETYESRFAAIKRRVDVEYPLQSENVRLRIAAHMIRDIMRMEMPQCWWEIRRYDSPHPPLSPIGITNPTVVPPLNPQWSEYTRATALLDFYHAAYNNGADSAALLFLITQNLNPEALEAFHGSEVGRDRSGMLVFLDAWGRPIRFLRWAPGFIDHSDLMHEEIADPTDEREGAPGWLLYPLIYSAGPDGIYGIQEGSAVIGTGGINGGILDPFAIDPDTGWQLGAPDGTNRHFDNIHNHQRHRSF